MRLIITGGGTGGHVFPGVAVAKELKSRNERHTILFAGAERGVETKIVPFEGFEIRTMEVTGIKGKGIFGVAASLWRLAKAVRESMRIISDFNPDVVLGVGGYASGAVGLAAIVMGKPLALAEQNSAPGLTNRWLGKFAKKVFVTWPGSEKSFPDGKAIVAGNPIRSEFFKVKKEKNDARLGILAIGGSQGARSINRAMVEAVEKLNSLADKIVVVHQTGVKELDAVRKGYEAAKFPFTVEAFFNDMPQRIADADIVITRSGAGAVAEICAVGRMAVYVPFPFAADDHQTKNAEAMASCGAALVVKDSEINGAYIVSAVAESLSESNRLKEMGAKAKAMAKPDAASAIADEILKLAKAA